MLLQRQVCSGPSLSQRSARLPASVIRRLTALALIRRPHTDAIVITSPLMRSSDRDIRVTRREPFVSPWLVRSATLFPRDPQVRTHELQASPGLLIGLAPLSAISEDRSESFVDFSPNARRRIAHRARGLIEYGPDPAEWTTSSGEGLRLEHKSSAPCVSRRSRMLTPRTGVPVGFLPAAPRGREVSSGR